MPDLGPTARPLDLPAAYGAPAHPLAWADVEARLVAAQHYWVVSVRPDGRPHAVPKDGLWIDGAWCYGGADETVHHRNIATNPHVVMHLEDAAGAVIVEGDVEIVSTTKKEAAALSAASKQKYGYAPPASAYASITRLRPTKVLAWNELPKDATRFDFP